MSTAHFSAPPAKRVKVLSDNNPQPTWLLVPSASRTVHDLLISLLLRLGLSETCTYDLCLDGVPILPNEDIALVRDGEELHLRLRHTPTATPTLSQPSNDPHMSSASIPENTETLPRKRKRVLTPVAKQRRNARNRKREKRRRLERRLSKNDVPDVPEVNNTPPDPDQEQDPSPQYTTKRPADQDDLEKVKEKRASSEPVAASIGHTDQKPTANEAVNEVISISPTSTTPRVNINPNPEQHSRDGDELRTTTETLPDPSQDACPLPAKPTLRSASHRDDIRRAIPVKKPNPRLSYVFLQKVSIEPSLVNVPQGDNSEKQNESTNAKEVSNSPVLRTSPEVRPTVQAPLDKTSGFIHDEIMSSAETNNAEEEQVETRRKRSVELIANLGNAEKQFITEGANKISAPEQQQQPEVKKVNSPERRQPAVNNTENTEDRAAANALDISATNPSAKENETPIHALMETDNSGCNNTSAAASVLLADKGKIKESSRVHKGSMGDLSDKAYPSKKTHSRLNQHRPQGKAGNHDKYDLGSKQVPPVPSDKQILSSQRKDPDQRTDRMAEPAHSNQVKKATMSTADENASVTKPIVCDIIDLVNDDEDDKKLFDNLPVLMHHPRKDENCPKSASPQSIVIAEPQTGDLRVARDSIEAMKVSSSQASKQVAGSVIQDEKERTCQDSGSARVSRRKPIRPRRLNKPETEDKVNDVNSISRAPSRDASHEAKNREALETLKKAVVKNLQSGRPGPATQNKEMTQSIVETPVHDVPEADEKAAAKGASNPEVPNEVRRKRKSLKGGLSTLAALRVAKAHAAIRLSSSKDISDINAQKLGVGTSNASESIKDGPTAMNVTARVVKNATRKKRGRSKRPEKTQRYFNELQHNKSIFVGDRPETLLPPPELLELLDGSERFTGNSDALEIVPETYDDGQTNVGLLDARKEDRPGSHGSDREIADEVQSFGSTTTGANPSKRKNIVSLKDPAVEKPPLSLAGQGGMKNKMSTEASLPRGGCEVALLAEEPSLRIADQGGVNSEVTTEASPAPQVDVEPLQKEPPQPPANEAEPNSETCVEAPTTPQEGSMADREYGTIGIANTHETTPAAAPGCFREDLVHMLQNTTQTLAKIWSKWET